MSALQLGKLADHVGDEIGLGEHRRAIGEHGIGAECGAIARSDDAHAVHAVRPACRAGCDRRRCASRRRASRAAAAVLVEEEPGVGQPCPQHALVALDDRRRILRVDGC